MRNSRRTAFVWWFLAARVKELGGQAIFWKKISPRVSISVWPVRLMDESSAAAKAEQVQQDNHFRRSRMKYVCLGFIDETKYAEVSQEEGHTMMEECLAYDDELRRGGHFLGGEALDSARNAVTLRMKDGEVQVTDGPYVETKEMLGGILLLEARDLNHAIALMSKHPGVKMGPFEIRPANEAVNRLIAERDAAVAKER
jgi:hypothetical protein